MISVYEITYILVCGDDGLISHTIKGIKEVIPTDGSDEDEEDEDEG